jgi:hypothetical protein
MSEESAECQETLYDLTELRGQPEDTAKLWQLVELLTRQSALYADSVQQLTKVNQSLRNAVSKMARELKVEAGPLSAPS